MAVRIATGSELRRVRTFINPNDGRSIQQPGKIKKVTPINTGETRDPEEAEREKGEATVNKDS